MSIDVSGRRLNIGKANFTPADDGKKYWDGWMGIDVMRSGFFLDFQTMRFSIE